jgi:hypothetical protein
MRTYYILSSCNDNTGTGEEAKPYKTFPKIPRDLRGKDRSAVAQSVGCGTLAPTKQSLISG